MTDDPKTAPAGMLIIDLVARLETEAASEAKQARHVTGPGFPPPWGADIIEGHQARSRTLAEAASALQGLQEEKKRAHAALKSIETMAGNMMFNIRQHGELTDADRVVRGLSDIEAVASRATREGGE